MVQLGWRGLQCELIISIILIVFVLFDAIDYVDCINGINHIDPGALNCRALQLKENSKKPTKYGMNFWGKKG